MTTYIQTDSPPERASRKIALSLPTLLQTPEHKLCPGCGHPVAWRVIFETLQELDLMGEVVTVVGHGCYTHMMINSDLDSFQCLHGRAPAAATGIKRMLPNKTVFAVQGDGDMANEGLHEIIHAAARGERITCIMLNNGVFGDTGGHMTAATPIGQRTKTSLEGRDAALHGHPIDVPALVALQEGAVYVARGAVNTAGMIARTKRMVHRAFELQQQNAGLTFVEILTMCPTGWFVGVADGPDYLEEAMMSTYGIGEIKKPQ